jgi:hypothetical protein
VCARAYARTFAPLFFFRLVVFFFMQGLRETGRTGVFSVILLISARATSCLPTVNLKT